MEIEILPYAYDDDLIEGFRRDGRPRVRVYRPDRLMVVLGRGSDPEKELEAEACLLDKVPVLKRRGGGCAVVLDEGNVIVSAVLPVEGYGNNDRHFRRLSIWLLDGLERAGVRGLRRAGTSDLVMGDRKIGGACIYRSKNFLLYTTALLVHPDRDGMARYLRHPPREPDYRRGRSHEEFVGALSPDPWPGRAVDLVEALHRVLRPGEALQALSP